MSKTIATCIKWRPWIAHIDDEREIGNAIIVTLASDFNFNDGEQGGVQGFDTIADMRAGTTKSKVSHLTDGTVSS